MSRLSDRAFKIIQTEINRCYGDTPTEQLERVIMLARLENLKQQEGLPLTKVELWEAFSDISPAFDPKALKIAASIDNPSPIIGASIGVGTVAILVGAAIGVENFSTGTAITNKSSDQDTPSQDIFTAKQTNASTAVPVSPKASLVSKPQFVRQTTHTQPVVNTISKDAFETAKAFGWQAALKSQNPPHSAQYWRETATLWAQAIELLDQVPKHSPNYTAAQAKKVVYQQNLETVQTLEQRSLTVIGKAKTTPEFSAPQEDKLTIAKRYGWQAALASQNAPHPAQKWAHISKLWQIAIQNLDQIDSQDALYAEAQEVKAQYLENLVVIRQRYQQEQNATQRLQSLQATLSEIEQSITLSDNVKKAQLNAIVYRLQSIPTSTVAYLQARSLIERTQVQISNLPTAPSARLAVSSTEAIR